MPPLSEFKKEIILYRLKPSTGSPQGCVLRPLFYSLCTCDQHFLLTTSLNSPTTPAWWDFSQAKMCLPTGRRGRDGQWCSGNKLTPNTPKPKELIIDFRRHSTDRQPFLIYGQCVEKVQSFKFLDEHITDSLSWSMNTTAVIRKAQQCSHFLRILRKNNLCDRLVVSFYRATIGSILTCCIAVYAGCSAADKKALQRITRSAVKITDSSPLPYKHHKNYIISRANKIIKDSSHPGHHLFELLLSGRHYWSIMSKMKQLTNRFFFFFF